MRNDKDIFELCSQVREAAFKMHLYLRHGHLETVYENGLVSRLRKSGLSVDQQRPLQVLDEDGTVLGDYYVDLFVENALIVELKACRTIINEHVAQTLGYLRASGCRDALLLNFGAPSLQVRKLIL
jgi:GxxExxY protein